MTSYSSAMVDPGTERVRQAAVHAPPELVRRARLGDPRELLSWVERFLRPSVDRGHWDANGSPVEAL